MSVINIKEVVKRHINGEASSDDIEVLASAYTFQAINNGKKDAIIAKLVEALEASNALFDHVSNLVNDDLTKLASIQIEDNNSAIKLAEGK